MVFPQLELSEEWVSEQLRGLPALPKSFIALAPGAIYGPAKQWPEVYYHEVAAQLAQKWNESILILGTPADHASGEKIAQGLSGVENWCGRSNLPQLVALLSRAKLLLSNDSGSMHIMAALQRPQLAILVPPPPPGLVLSIHMLASCIELSLALLASTEPANLVTQTA